MDDSNQIEVPPSFVALYTARSGDRLTRPPQAVRERYEVCEDLAQMLAEQASAAQFKTGASEHEAWPARNRHCPARKRNGWSCASPRSWAGTCRLASTIAG
jgi:hypothetical protein